LSDFAAKGNGTKKAPRLAAELLRFRRIYGMGNLQFAHVGSLGTFLTLGYLKADPVAFSQGFETLAGDSRKVNEYIGTIVLLDETETLGVIKPFHSAFSHFSSCSFCFPVEPV
jgi:hypothetical protein